MAKPGTAGPPRRQAGSGTAATYAHLDSDTVAAGGRGTVATKPGDDPLGIQEDVNAFARLIALDQTGPLSIGLFGEWGSGKSTFMARLQSRIDWLAEEEAKRRALSSYEPPGQGQQRFASRIVQIRFNAWSYADANLWASLTAEFFDQLRAGGADQAGGAIHAKLVERVTTHVNDLASKSEAAKAAVDAGEKKVADAQKVRDAAAAKAAGANLDAFSQVVVDQVAAAYEEVKPKLAVVGKRSKAAGAAVESVDNFFALVKDLRSMPGQLWTVLQVSARRGWLVTFLIVAAVFVAAAIALRGYFATTTWASLAAFASGVVAVAPGIRFVASILKATSSFADKIEEVSGTEMKAVVESEAALKAATEEAAARRAALSRAQRELARYLDSNATGNPLKLLRYLLEDDPETQAIAREVGLISRARRLFQEVDAVVANERVKRAKKKHLPLSQADRDRKIVDPDEPDLDVPDRIVLYIDDLDRCTYDQVYAVLQAVHLLLAFDLFVVVVGVDLAWIDGALAKHFEIESKGAGKLLTDPLARKAQTFDYLEKIFQVPFWLPRLTATGSYRSYVDRLLEGKVEADAETPKDMLGIGDPTRSAPADDKALAGADDLESDGLAAALESIRIREREARFLASEKLGAVANKSPRAVKRLLNIYRLVRARLSPEELEAFLGEGGPPAYPVYAAVAALEVGQPVAVIEAFHRHLEAVTDTAPFVTDRDKAEFSDSLRMLFVNVDNVRKQGMPIGARTDATIADYKRAARLVGRYSFNSYRPVEG